METVVKKKLLFEVNMITKSKSLESLMNNLRMINKINKNNLKSISLSLLNDDPEYEDSL